MNRPHARITRLLLILVGIGASTPGIRGQAVPHPEVARLKRHVETLASPDYQGRRGEGARKAEAYLIDQFRALGLEPAFDGQFTQDIPGKTPDQVVGRNVGAKLVGSDSRLREEWIIVSAHYDHLGVHQGVVFPGADDNASGVAMMLEVARCLSGSPVLPRRSVLFVGFDLEENGLWGSRHFVERPPFPLDRIKLFLTADMIGGALGGVCTQQVFVLGTEHAPELRPWINQAADGQPIKVALIGSDLLVFDRSDYGPFRARQVPYLFFSTGENPRYHTPNDTPAALDHAKVETVSRLITSVVRQAVSADALPAWNPKPDSPIAEAQALREVLQILLDHRQALQIKGTQISILESTLKQLDTIVTRGEFSRAERTRIVRIAQFLLYTAL